MTEQQLAYPRCPLCERPTTDCTCDQGFRAPSYQLRRDVKETPDFRHLVVDDVTKYLMSKCDISEPDARARAEKLMVKVDQIAYAMMWEKPEGCVCAGPSDPYHSWCSACEDRRKRLT